MAEEFPRSDLDVAGLKAQILEPIEELEERVRERQEILSEIVPAMEARGYNTGGLKAVMAVNLYCSPMKHPELCP